VPDGVSSLLRSEWSLRNTGLYLFGTQVVLSSCMLVMICTYITMGFVRFSPEGNGHAQFGIFPYPKTAFLPFGSTVRHAFSCVGGWVVAAMRSVL